MILVRSIAPAALASVENEFTTLMPHIVLVQMLDKNLQMLKKKSFANQLPCPDNGVASFKIYEDMDTILQWFTTFSQKHTLHKYVFM